MKKAKRIGLLERLLEQASELEVRESSNPKFKTWRNTVERTLVRVFGPGSPELEQFKELDFFYCPIMWSPGDDFTPEHRRCFDRDFDILKSSIRNYIEEIGLEDEVDPVDQGVQDSHPDRRLFISHSSRDLEFVEEIIDLLEGVGLPSESIFCTSFSGYGIDLGENFLEVIREELSNDVLVLFVLTKNFFDSPVCLCEMGAVWVQTKEHIPILVPPFDFSDIQGVIPLTQGFKINDPAKLNLFRAKIEDVFEIKGPLGHIQWERKRDRTLQRIEDLIASGVDSR